MIYVNSIQLFPSYLTLLTGEWQPPLSYHVLPENATCKSVTWESDRPWVASVNPTNGQIHANAYGYASIYAIALDGGGVRGVCNVSVYSAKVDSIDVYPKQKTLCRGETINLNSKICPSTAGKASIRWTSSDSSVASVGAETGVVTAISDGTAIITASAIHGTASDSCTITVDSREKVIIRKDSHSFHVEFADGKVWRNIGIDLTNRTENYKAMYPPAMSLGNYDALIEEEQRYLDNIFVEKDGVMVNNTYSEKQIGFLYLLDPFGIEYYMRNHACQNMSLEAMLFFKDRVYKEIFGVWPRLIKVFPNKSIQYYEYYTSISAETRADYYTDAEILFGEHPIYDLASLISFLLDVVPSVSVSLFSIFYPPAGLVLGSIELVKFLFFSASASGVLSSGASSIMEEYTSNVYSSSDGESAGIKAGKAMGWVNFVLGAISTILDASKVFTPSINDITVYNKVNEGDYRVNYNISGSELSMADIISRVS